MEAQIRRLFPQWRKLGGCFLHPVFTKNALARRYGILNAAGGMEFGNSHQCYGGGVSPGIARGGVNTGADMFKPVRKGG